MCKVYEGLIPIISSETVVEKDNKNRDKKYGSSASEDDIGYLKKTMAYPGKNLIKSIQDLIDTEGLFTFEGYPMTCIVGTPSRDKKLTYRMVFEFGTVQDPIDFTLDTYCRVYSSRIRNTITSKVIKIEGETFIAYYGDTKYPNSNIENIFKALSKVNNKQIFRSC